MVSLLGGSDDAIELQCVVLARAFARHLAKIGLVWAGAGDAKVGLSGMGSGRERGKYARDESGFCQDVGCMDTHVAEGTPFRLRLP